MRFDFLPLFEPMSLISTLFLLLSPHHDHTTRHIKRHDMIISISTIVYKPTIPSHTHMIHISFLYRYGKKKFERVSTAMFVKKRARGGGESFGETTRQDAG